jgi:hypothetical protein
LRYDCSKQRSKKGEVEPLPSSDRSVERALNKIDRRLEKFDDRLSSLEQEISLSGVGKYFIFPHSFLTFITPCASAH